MNSRTSMLKACAGFLREIATTSVCKRRGVSAMVFNRESFQIVGWGVNGPAAYLPELCSGEKDKCGCAHSEVNTILNCRLLDSDLLDGCVMMLSRAPCVPCATVIVNCGFITHLYYLDESEPGAQGLAILKACGITISRYEDGKENNELRTTVEVHPTG